VSGEEQPQERFVQIDTFPNTVIDVGGRLIYSQEFTKACLKVLMMTLDLVYIINLEPETFQLTIARSIWAK